jgi:hypothetical protein
MIESSRHQKITLSLRDPNRELSPTKHTTTSRYSICLSTKATTMTESSTNPFPFPSDYKLPKGDIPGFVELDLQGTSSVM